jgi:glycosyltransferase involved in cell wall biosynthesis
MQSRAKQPLVSIVCVTYNHEQYITQAIESFLAQETDFDFEILIHDDASTDNTPEIIMKYASNNSNIKPLLEKKNRFSQGDDSFIKEMFMSARGKYIAQCEGDDFWTDTHKLQEQVDLLEKRKDLALCFHPVKVFFEGGTSPSYLFPARKNGFTLAALLRSNYIQSNSTLYRAQDYSNLASNIMPMDWYLHLFHAQFGRIGFIDKTMSAYRKHEGGIWWGGDDDRSVFWHKYGLSHLRVYAELLNMFGKNKEYKRILYQVIEEAFTSFVRVLKPDDRLINDAVMEFPGFASQVIINQGKHLDKSMKQIQSRDAEINQLNIELHDLRAKSEELNIQFENIKSSRFWKFRNRLVKLIGKKPIY